jgi:1,4-alpha-glucan branching enzyme
VNALEAMTAVLLLSPHIPLLFMGEEWGETTPFCFFTDYEGDLAEAVRRGRREEFSGFAAFADRQERAAIPDPNAPSTFTGSRPDWERRETEEGRRRLDLVRHLVRVRQSRVVPLLDERDSEAGRVLADEDGLLAVDWRLAAGLLQMRANFSDRNAALPPVAGDVIYRGGRDGADLSSLPPCTVVVAVAP